MRNPFRHITGVETLKDEPLSRHTSFHIGGNARYFIRVFSIKALKAVLCVIKNNEMRYFVVGAGTNLLVSDKGFPGVVLRLKGVFTRVRKKGSLFHCGGGVLVEGFLKRVSKLGYGGAEFLAGIPGTIGGGIKGNAGAFGRSFADIVEGIDVISTRNTIGNLSREEIGFGYRSSHLRDGLIITFAQIRLVKRDQRDVTEEIEKKLKYRRLRQPVGYTAGSYFRNIDACPAGKLIEECDLKGLSIGDAEVSRKHGNFIINRGNAKASEILKLAKIIKKTVREKTGISLKEEVKLLS